MAHKKLGEMIQLDCQPLTIVEDIGFNFFMKELEPWYVIPSRKYFSDNVMTKIPGGDENRTYEKGTLT